MENSSKYVSCNVEGDGNLSVVGSNEVSKFNIVDMSAIGINIQTSAEILQDTKVKLKLRLKGILLDAYMDVDGKVTKRDGNNYTIEFIDLSDDMREQIDELMRSACNIT